MDSKQALHLQFREDQWIRYNVKLSKKVGIYGSILLGYLINKEIYYSDKGQLVDGAYFFATRSTIEEHTALSPHQQREAIKELKECGFLVTKDMCTPRKTFYAIVHDKLSNFLTTSDQKIEPLDVEDLNDIYEYRNMSTEKENRYRIKDVDTAHTAPTLSDIFSKLQSGDRQAIQVLAEPYPHLTEETLTTLLASFLAYWTEPTISGKRQRWQMEKTFEIRRRFATWVKNAEKFGDMPKEVKHWVA